MQETNEDIFDQIWCGNFVKNFSPQLNNLPEGLSFLSPCKASNIFENFEYVFCNSEIIASKSLSHWNTFIKESENL